MSKKCPICRSINCIVEVGKAEAGKPWFTCLHCHTDLWEEEILPVTVFDHITQNEEVLAEFLVFHNCIYKGRTKYHSAVVGGEFDSKEKAFDATVEKLKKEWKR